MKQITRKRALELAMECITADMIRTNQNMSKYIRHSKHYNDMEAEYAELAAALAYIENLARQKELL